MPIDVSSMSLQEALEAGVAHHQAGRLAEAEACYRQALRLDPNEPDALHLLGSLALAAGQYDTAAQLVQRAVGLRSSAIYHHTLGLIHVNTGNLAAASFAVDQALTIDPNLPDAHYLGGLILAKQKQPKAAAESLERAVALRPGWAAAHHGLGGTYKDSGDPVQSELNYSLAVGLDPNLEAAWAELAVLQRELGRTEDALVTLRAAVRARPEFAGGWTYLGLTAAATGDRAEAESAARRGAELAPGMPEAWRSLAIVLRGNGDRIGAADAMTRAARIRPDDPAVLTDLGHDLLAVGRIDEAIAVYKAALQRVPDSSNLYDFLGAAFNAKGSPGESLACLNKAVELDPSDGDAWVNLAVVRFETGDVDGAIAAGRRAVELRPGSSSPHANLANALGDAGRIDDAITEADAAVDLDPADAGLDSNRVFFRLFSPTTTPAAYVAEARRWNDRHTTRPTPAPPPARRSPNPVRVGYVSADFTKHAVGRFLMPILQGHDRSRFEVHCFSNVGRPDEMTASYKPAADHWHDIRYKSDDQAERMIRDAGIDVLVDTSGHTGGNRLPLFGRRPAPVQISYLAYCATTGIDAIDYLVVDPYFWPDGSDPAELVEKPLKVPNSYWCYRPTGGVPDVGPPPVDRNRFVTFGSLNNVATLSDECLATWWRVLNGVPDSRILIYARQGSARDRIAASAATAGVGAGRVSFIGFRPIAEYFDTYHEIDVQLDGYPFTGGTTTADSLYMGVPVVTRTGPMTVSRGSSSLLHNVGLGELVADSADRFVDIATRLGTDRATLAAARKDLRIRMQSSPVMDEKRFVRDLEEAYLSVLPL